MEIAAERTKSEARYAYYRRCQVFMKNGRQCKAPAEKGAQICRNHAGQIETEMRRERERWAVLEITAEQMRAAGHKDFSARHVFDDPRAIRAAMNVIMQALASDAIEDKTAARLLNELQMALTHPDSARSTLGRSRAIPKVSGADPSCPRSRKIGVLWGPRSACRPRDDIQTK